MTSDDALIIQGRRRVRKSHQLTAPPDHIDRQLEALRAKRLQERYFNGRGSFDESSDD